MTRQISTSRIGSRRCLTAASRALLAAVVLALWGCPTNQSLVLIRGETVDAATIDSQPLKVLPTGALLLGQLNAQALFQTNLGGQVSQLANNLLPLGQESGFVPTRDVQRIIMAVYAMQGADFCAVLQGSFDVAAIRQAADVRAQTPSGVPLVKTPYAGNDIYTVANIGFVLLTGRTILSGNETGLRRALDRLRFGPSGEIPEWQREVLDHPQAELALVGDVENQGVVAATSDQVPFFQGLRLVRVLGNFKPPGMNVVGTLTYSDVATAGQGAQALGQLQQLSFLISFLTSLGFGQTPELEVVHNGTDVQFSLEMDTSMISVLLSMAIQATNPASVQPIFWGT